MGPQLLHDHKYWHRILHEWLARTQWENRKCAIYALHAFHRQLAAEIAQHRRPEDAAILQHFIDTFKSTLQSVTAQSHQIRIAIHGFGVMASAAKALLPPEYLSTLLTLVMQRTELTAIAGDRDMLEHYPDFVQALSEIMQHMTGELSGLQIASLQAIIIALIKDFYYLSAVHHGLAIVSLLRTFDNLAKLGGTTLDTVLERIVLQGVIWTCSHKLVYDSNLDWSSVSDWKEHVTYRSFLPLWNGLLSATATEVTAKLFEHLMQTLFTILERLDLSTQKRTFRDASTGEDNEWFFCDPNLDFQPVRPKDFHIFFNVVQLYRDILMGSAASQHWPQFQQQFMQQFCETIIGKALQYPLVSGFVRLLQIAMYILSKSAALAKVDRDTDSLFQSLVYLVEYQIEAVQQMYGELQIAGFDLLFAAPTELLPSDLTKMIPVFRRAFDIGQSMLSLAVRALRALDRLHRAQCQRGSGGSSVWLERVLPAVLPSLDSYLQSNGFVSNGMVDVEFGRARKRIKKMVRNSGIAADSELVSFQKSILVFLGEYFFVLLNYFGSLGTLARMLIG